MNRENKSAAIGAVIAAMCIVVYVFALIQATVRLYLSIDQRRTTAEQEFSNITTLALSAGTQGFMNDRFIEVMNNALASSEAIEALIITGPEGEYAFERQQGYAVTWVDNSPRFINRFSFSNQDYYRSLPINDLRYADIRSVARAFDFFEISKILKETLLLILIGFAIAFFSMLLQILLGKPVERTRGAYSPAYQRAAPEPAPRPQQYAARDAPIAQDFSHNYSNDFSHDYSSMPETVPKGLYSPRSNIGWEEYTRDRLDSELHRCASTEKDLTLVLLEFTALNDDSLFMKAAEEVISFFASRDMLFEYGSQGILVILPDTDLDTGISKSEKFYQRFTEKYPGKRSSSSLCIGLSSRSGRLLNADRLMLEVQEALEKAKRDRKSSLVAFKSDPEKYRAFIRRQA